MSYCQKILLRTLSTARLSVCSNQQTISTIVASPYRVRSSQPLLAAGFRSSTLNSGLFTPFLRAMGVGSSNLANTPEAKFVQETIDSNCVVIFSKSTCSYCRMAKKVFSDIGVNYMAIELNQVQGGGILQDVLGSMTGEYTVPRVFINGRCVGGGTEVRNLQKQGKLQDMIQTCRVAEPPPDIPVKSEL